MSLDRDELLIGTPWGAKRWSIVRRGLELYEQELRAKQIDAVRKENAKLKRNAEKRKQKQEEYQNANNS